MVTLVPEDRVALMHGLGPRWFGPKGRETGLTCACTLHLYALYCVYPDRRAGAVRVNTVSNPPHHPERQIYDLKTVRPIWPAMLACVLRESTLSAHHLLRAGPALSVVRQDEQLHCQPAGRHGHSAPAAGAPWPLPAPAPAPVVALAQVTMVTMVALLWAAAGRWPPLG